MKAACLALLAVVGLPGAVQAQDSLSARIGKIRGMVEAIHAELDSLSRDLAARKAGVPAQDTARAEATGEKPILGEILTERQKRLAAAAAFSYDRLALGYSIDAIIGIGMHAEAWTGRWGWRVAGTTRFNGDTRLAGLETMALRSLHRFSLFQGLQTRLYALAGVGAYWRRVPYLTGYSPGTIVPPPETRQWYETPDIPLLAQLGAGTELGLFTLGGLRAAPEIGLQAANFLSRYQDSESWQSQKRNQTVFEDRPKSDFSLDAYLAFHLSFYFR